MYVYVCMCVYMCEVGDGVVWESGSRKGFLTVDVMPRG